MPDFINPECPLLPSVDRVWRATEVNALGKDRGPRFYEASLHYAQSQWRTGFPAQALLQVNRAFACVLDPQEPVLEIWPLPYRVMLWLMQHRTEGQFIGNPRRHFQHLATRMVEPNKALRTWRAWACWYLAKSILSEEEFPGDMKQIREERIVEPTRAQIEQQLTSLSPGGDVEAWHSALAEIGLQSMVSSDDIVFRRIDADEVAEVQRLAHLIWPQVYPGIITHAQIDYMLAQRYTPEVLRADIERGVCLALIETNGRAAGYLAVEPRGEEAFLHKLYLLPETAGTGLGAKTLQWISDYAQAEGCTQLRLCVNKQNTRAIRAYLRSGFTFERDAITEIGDGFVMDDFIMIKALPDSTVRA